MTLKLKWIGVAALVVLILSPSTSKSENSPKTNREVREQLVTFVDIVSAHYADGQGWSTEFVFVNLSDTLQFATVYFLDSSGNLQNVNLKERGTAKSVDLMLLPYGSARVETTGTSKTVTQGSALLLPEGSLIDNRLGGNAIFRLKRQGLPTYEASVPFESFGNRKAYLPFDHRNGYTSGIAVVNNSNDHDMTLGWDFYDEGGLLISSGTLLLGAKNHGAFSLTGEFPELAERVGMMVVSVVESDEETSGFGILGLRFNPDGPFTTISPMLSLSESLED